MASSIVFLIAILLPLSPVLGDADLIQKTCQQTQYPDLCTSALNSFTGSQLTDAVKGLATIMINAASGDAADTSRFISSELVKTVADPAAVKVFWRCGEDYSQAKTSLDGSVVFVNSGDLDLGSIAVSVCRDYSDRCRDSFTFLNPPLFYPGALEQREVRFVELVAVADDIIKQLVNTD